MRSSRQENNSAKSRDNVNRYLKIVCCLGLLAVLIVQVWSMSRWNERRGVNDDFCYLRQAHLFQKYGLGGLNTSVARDDEAYWSATMKEMNLAGWKDLAEPPCHVLMPATKKFVMQYPPGTGFVMALFPSGHQVIPLFVLATLAVFGFGLLAIAYADTALSILLTAVFADAAVYMMINPTKASYSMAPTMVVCALAGYLTARLFVTELQRHRLVLAMLTGLLLGIAVDFRLANLFLSAGYFVCFLVAFLGSRTRKTLLQLVLFGIAFLAGAAPTLLANAINAGSPFATTYGGGDAAAPELSAGILWDYASDLQGVLLLLAAAWTVAVLRSPHRAGTRQVASVVAVNLLVNVAFFLTHPVFTPYYTIPVAMLSLWSLLFAWLMGPSAGDEAVPRARPAAGSQR